MTTDASRALLREADGLGHEARAAGLDGKALQQRHGQLGRLRAHLTRLKDLPLDHPP